MAVKVDTSTCTGCGICAQVCPMGALTVDQVVKIDAAVCVDCYVCVTKCPQGALRISASVAMPPARAPGAPAGTVPRKPSFAQPDISRPEAGQAGFRILDAGGIVSRIFSFFSRRSGRGSRRGSGRCRGGHGRRLRG